MKKIRCETPFAYVHGAKIELFFCIGKRKTLNRRGSFPKRMGDFPLALHQQAFERGDENAATAQFNELAVL